jgi:hypothetical protein
MERDPEAIDHVRISIEQVLTKALADVFGRGRHGAVAARLAEAIMTDFGRVNWRVMMPRRRRMGDQAEQR